VEDQVQGPHPHSNNNTGSSSHPKAKEKEKAEALGRRILHCLDMMERRVELLKRGFSFLS
jgi:hypothetical protein